MWDAGCNVIIFLLKKILFFFQKSFMINLWSSPLIMIKPHHIPVNSTASVVIRNYSHNFCCVCWLINHSDGLKFQFLRSEERKLFSQLSISNETVKVTCKSILISVIYCSFCNIFSALIFYFRCSYFMPNSVNSC